MPRSLVVLTYKYVPDILERRGPFRDRHLGLLGEGAERGEVVMAGATGDPVSGGLILFTSHEAATAFVEADPYGQNGLVVSHDISPWTVVVGA